MSRVLDRRTAAALAALAAAVVVLLVGLSGSEYQIYVGTLAATYVVSMAGFNLVFGVARMFALAHVAFFGVGAYAFAYALEDEQLPRVVALGTGALAGLVVAALVSLVAWRVADLLLALVTFAVLSLAQIVFQRAESYTGGNIGKAVAPIESLDFRGVFLVTALVAAVCVVLASLMTASRVGRRWKALGDSEPAAASTGISARREKVVAFACSGAFAGLAGGLYMQVVQYVTPESFGFASLTMLLVAVTVGGPGSPVGTAVATVAVVLVNEGLRSYPSAQAALFGVVLIAVLALRGRPAVTRWTASMRWRSA